MPSHFRPLLADIVQEQDIKQLCKLLVVVSGEAAKAYAGIALAIMLVLPSEFYHFRMTKYPGEPAVLLACMSYLGDIQWSNPHRPGPLSSSTNFFTVTLVQSRILSKFLSSCLRHFLSLEFGYWWCALPKFGWEDMNVYASSLHTEKSVRYLLSY